MSHKRTMDQSVARVLSLPWYLLLAMRPKQWIKNVVVLAALVFSVSFLDWTHTVQAVAAFLIFCAVSGSVYLVNDSLDVEEDRRHPEKRHRPIASGKLPLRLAQASAAVLTLGSLIAAVLLNPVFGGVVALYLALNLAYSLHLKEFVILDVLIIALGFMLRAVAGAVVIQVEISPWLIIGSLFLALFLALNKRKAELDTLEAEAAGHRQSLGAYTHDLLDQMILIVTAAILLSYALYTFNSEHSNALMWSIPFVIYGVFRYMYLVQGQGLGGSLEDVLLSDRPLLICVLLWGLTVVGILLYFNTSALGA